MGYYASGDGSIGFSCRLKDAEEEQVLGILREEFEDAGFSFDEKHSYVSFWSNGKYYDTVLAVLENISTHYPVESGCVEYSGEDGCHWRFRYIPGETDSENITGKWVEENGYVCYDRPDDFVYVLDHRWDTEENEGGELRVYSSDCLEVARREMRRHADKVRAEYREMIGKDPWEDDYTWETEDEIHLGYAQGGSFPRVNTYSWTIDAQVVIGV